MESLLTITQLNDFIFCPRSLYYNGIFRNNTDQEFYHQTAQQIGLAAHQSIDEGRYSSRKNVLTGIMVYCEKYNLLGRIDIFDIDKGILTERKYSVSAIYDGFKFQLYAQFFALREMGYFVKQMQLYSKKDNKMYPVRLPTQTDIAVFEELLHKMRMWSPETDSTLPNPNKCKRCIYSTLCEYGGEE